MSQKPLPLVFHLLFHLLIIFITRCWEILPRSLKLHCPEASISLFVDLNKFGILKHTLDLVLGPLERHSQPALTHNTTGTSRHKSPGAHLTHQQFSALHTRASGAGVQHRWWVVSDDVTFQVRCPALTLRQPPANASQ